MANNDPSPSGSDTTRQRIIDAALQLFGQIGYARTTTRAIAVAAEVNEVTLFRHFGSKKQLLAACVTSFNASSFAETFQQRLIGDYRQDIWMMAQAQLSDLWAGFDLVRLLLCDAQEIPELLAIFAAGAQNNAAQIADYYRHQIAAGVVRADLDPVAAAQAFDSLFSWPVFMAKVLPGGGFSYPLPDQFVHDLVDIFVQGTIQR
jgi:AcrR family transcriptional regulator